MVSVYNQASLLHSMPSALHECDDIDLIFLAMLRCCIAGEGWVQLLRHFMGSVVHRFRSCFAVLSVRCSFLACRNCEALCILVSSISVAACAGETLM